MRIIAASLAVLLSATAAYALQHPIPAQPLDRGGDPHVRVAVFTPSEPVLLVGAVGRPMAITFGPTEHIRRVLLENGSVIDGKKVDPPWQGPDGEQLAQQPLGNVLPLWPMRAGRSSAQVITGTEDGSNRVYALELVALPPQPNECPTRTSTDGVEDCDDPRITTALSFLYPEERKAETHQAMVQKAAAQAKLTAEDRLRQDIFYGPRNWKYFAKGTPEAVKLLAPNEISDNTQATGMLYQGNRHIPALYVVEPGNPEHERMVETSPDKDLLVLYEAVPGCPHMLESCPRLRLRKGTLVVDLYNVSNADDVGVNVWTGTTSPSVVRVVKTVAPMAATAAK